MNLKYKILAFGLLTCLAVPAMAKSRVGQPPAGNEPAETYPFQNPKLSAEKRADDLLSRLTLQEKVSLMMHQSPAIERLGIGSFQWWNEALHGVGRNGKATVFPITMAMAASFDEALLKDVYTAVSDEARAKNQAA